MLVIPDVLFNENKSELIIKNMYKLYRININDIYYLEKCCRKIEIVLKDNPISFYGSFIQIEKMLTASNFFKCHKSYIVNCNKVFMIDKDEITFEDINEHAYVSREYKNELFEKLEPKEYNSRCSAN